MLPDLAKGIIKAPTLAHWHDHSVSAAAAVIQRTTGSSAESAAGQQLDERREPVQPSRLSQVHSPTSMVHPIRPNSGPKERPMSPKMTEGGRPTKPSMLKDKTINENGWRSRVRAGSKLRSSRIGPDQSSIDMSDVRTSLKSLSSSRRTRRGSLTRLAYVPDLKSLEER